jgi:hypothetical protein
LEEALDLSFDRLLMMMMMMVMMNGMNIKTMMEYVCSVMSHWYLLNVTLLMMSD